MGRPAILVDNLSKSYQLGRKVDPNASFRDAIVGAVSSPFRRLKQLGRGGDESANETFWALKDVSFEVQPGEVVGVIGRNGAGKSTLLKILSRITEPTAGSVRLRGRISSLLEVGTGFHPELTGRENVYLNGTILGMKKTEIDRKFDEIVEFSGVEKFLDTPVKRYSSGMMVRLGFAVAAHLEPDVLIVDEVLAVGDADFQRKCIDKMRDVATSGERTVLLVSHNMSSIASLAAHCLYLSEGRKVTYGTTDDVIELYLKQNDKRVDSGEPGLFVPVAEGGQKSMLKSLEILSCDRRTNRIRMGDDLNFRFLIDGQARPDIQSGLIGINIETLTGMRLVSLGSVHADFRFSTVGNEICVTCNADEIPLNQGHYRIRVVLGDIFSSPIENHESLGTLEVLPADVFGCGPILGSQQGVIYWKAKWLQH